MALADNDLLDLFLGRTKPASDLDRPEVHQVLHAVRASRTTPPSPFNRSRGIRHDPVRRQSHPFVLRRQPEHGPADLQGHDRPRSDRHQEALRADRQVHLRPGVPLDRVVQLDDHLHRRRQGRAALPRLPDRAAGDAVRLPRDLLPAAQRRAAERGGEGVVLASRHPSHDGQRADAVLPARLSPRRPPDGDPDRPRRRALGLLSRLDRHQ